MEKTYNVILHKGTDFQSFHSDMTTITNLDGVPNREVVSPNERLGSKRQGWYSLTEEEVALVKSHKDVLEVEIPPENRTDIQIGLNSIQSGSFNRAPDSDGDNSVDALGTDINWGLLRCSAQDQNYGTQYVLNEVYKYNLDGKGVDVVIQDSGIDGNHADFTDANGNSRVNASNWSTLSGVSVTNGNNNLTDTDGHGTHVCGIAAGKRFGWAKGSTIYSQKIAGLEGSGDTSGVAASAAFDAIKLWHRNKPINPATGHKRPTIVNMSWGYGYNYAANISVNISFRGALTSSADSGERTAAGLNTYDTSDSWRVNARITSVDTDVEELIDEGVHVVVAAGNLNYLVVGSSHQDYDNYVVGGGVTRYYHRGSSPFSTEAFIVGAVDYLASSATQDQRATFSNHGPGVDVYAPGRFIISAQGTASGRSGKGNYPPDNTYKQLSMSGTSQAAPQVAGVGALFLQANPGITPAELKRTMLANAGTGTLSNTGTTALSSDRSLQGGEDKYLFSKFAQEDRPLVIEGPVNMSLNFEL